MYRVLPSGPVDIIGRTPELPHDRVSDFFVVAGDEAVTSTSQGFQVESHTIHGLLNFDA